MKNKYNNNNEGRSVMILLNRRTGLPLYHQSMIGDFAPIHPTDSVVVVVASRFRRDQQTMGAFNPVLSDSIYKSLTGKESNSPYSMKMVGFSFGAGGVACSRFAHFLDNPMGNDTFEKVARNYSLAFLTNPSISSGIYYLRGDANDKLACQDSTSPSVQDLHKTMYMTTAMNGLMGCPTLNELGADIHQGNGVFGEAYWPMLDMFKFKPESEGAEVFKSFVVNGILLPTDVNRIREKGEDYYNTFNQMVRDGAITDCYLPSGSMREFILSKLSAGCQDSVYHIQNLMKSFIVKAEFMNIENRNDEEKLFESQRAAKMLFEKMELHAKTGLLESIVRNAVRKATREGKKVKAEHLSRPGGGYDTNTMQLIANLPNVPDISSTAKMILDWHTEAVMDLVASVAGLTAMFNDRDESGRVRTFVCPAPNGIGEITQKLGVRPSFSAIRGLPVQVVDRSLKLSKGITIKDLIG